VSAILVDTIPDAILNRCKPLSIDIVQAGRSVAQVYKLITKNDVFYLKVMSERLPMSFAKEVELLTWLQGKLPVPVVTSFFKHHGQEFLLLTEVTGSNGVEQIGHLDSASIVSELARGLRRIHDLNYFGCPSDETTPAKLKRAQQNLEHGLVDESDFDLEQLGRSAQSIYQELVTSAPGDDDLVFSHGDYCLPNVIFRHGQVAGFIDMDRAGIANRYNDLAIASRSIKDNLGTEFESLFFQRYGLENIDEKKIKYFRMLDEMF